MRRSLRLALIDQRAFWRRALKEAIERLDSDATVIEAASVGDLLARGSEAGLAVAVLCLSGAEDEDLAALDRLGAALPDLPVVVVADGVAPVDMLRVLRRGARGFIPGTLDAGVMVEALRLVAAGGVYVPEDVIAYYDALPGQWAAVENARTRLQALVESCTPRQRQVVDLVCQGKPNKIIAFDLGISENTVKAHLRHIMKKLKVRNRTELVLMASGQLTRDA